MGSSPLFLCPLLLFRNMKKQELAGKMNCTKIRQISSAVDVCRELDHTIMIKQNQPVLFLVTDIHLLSRIEKSVSPSLPHIPNVTWLLQDTSAGLGRTAHQQRPLSVYLQHMCKYQFCLPSDALSRTVLIPQLNKKDL